MFQFFVEQEQIGQDTITITGSDVNHIKNVIRLKPGNEIRVSNREDKDYICEITDISNEEVVAKIIDVDLAGTELKTKVYLFQGLPKGDKMETVIQKNVELGVYEIIPVAMKRSIVKLDAKKAEAKVKRWNGISESAAKQSKRMIIPNVTKVMTYKEAIEYAKELDICLVPYENAKDMIHTREIIESIKNESKVGIFIGPEGGFEEDEIESAIALGMETITLGKRILRTETAGMAIMAVIAYMMEE